MEPKRGRVGAKGEKRKLLCAELAAAVRKLQEDYVLKKNIESGNAMAEQLCCVLEAIFLHELKDNKGKLWREMRRPNMLHPPQPSFWTFIDPLVSDEVKMQLMALRDSESDVKKCRSWLRIMLSKGLLMSFLEDLLKHPGLLAFHYGGDSVLRDTEQFEIIIQLLKGLTTIQLEYDYTNPALTTWDTPVLQMAGIWSQPSSPKKGHERISPPPSSFDLEGAAVIGLALNKYSQKRTSAGVTDSQLIAREIVEQTSEGEGSQTSLDSGRYRGGVAAARSSPRSVPSATMAGRRGRETEKKEDFSLAVSLDFEVVSESAALSAASSSTSQTLTSLLTKLVTEKGLDSQNYLCAGCKRPIGVIFGQSKLCKYNGQHYCYDCHLDDERIIPSRVLFNWDFRKHRVCVASCEFLDSIADQAVLNVEEVNEALYLYIPELEEARKLRLQLNSLKEYLTTCKENEALEQFRRKLRHAHLYEEIHSYSITELTEVNSGVLLERMRRAIRIGTKHVKQCALCSQKGFICEGCHSDTIIYPFDLQDTFQCASCNALFHLACQPPKGGCSKCDRIRKRKEALVEEN